MKNVKRTPETIARMILDGCRHQYNLAHYFRDMIDTCVIALRNNVEPRDVEWQKREQQYEAIKSKYTEEDMKNFQIFLAEIVLLSGEEMGDHLGAIYQYLELNSKGLKQNFTPYSLSLMMARMTFNLDQFKEEIRTKGYVTVSDPACGAGSLLIATAQVLKENGFDPSVHMRATATDIDLLCVHMCYLQMRLFSIPAAVIHGDTLRLAEYDALMTPQYILQYENQRKNG